MSTENHHQRVQVLKKLAFVAVLGWIGLMLRAFLGAYFLTPVPVTINGVQMAPCGLAVLPGLLGGGLLGATCGVILGAFIARRIWSKPPNST